MLNKYILVYIGGENHKKAWKINTISFIKINSSPDGKYTCIIEKDITERISV